MRRKNTTIHIHINIKEKDVDIIQRFFKILKQNHKSPSEFFIEQAKKYLNETENLKRLTDFL